MRFNKLIWGIVIVVSLIVGYFFTIDRAGPERIGAIIGSAIGALVWPAVVTGIVIGIGYLIKTPPAELTRRIVFLSVWGISVLVVMTQSARSIGMTREQEVSVCIKALKDSAKYDIAKVMNLEKYCKCALEKASKKMGSDSNIIAEARDRNSVLFNEVIMTCVQSAMIDSSKASGSVLGLAEVDTVPVLNTFRGIKAKLKIGGEDYYFTFDSGASDIMVSDKLEKEFAKKGLITGYLEDMNYQMANGEIITCRRAYVSDIQLGNFLVTESIVAFYDGDIEYLLGKSFMDNFSSWSFSSDRNALILHK